jgi:hypothetical protein
LVKFTMGKPAKLTTLKEEEDPRKKAE